MSFWGSFWGGGRDAVGALWVRMNRDVPLIGGLGNVFEVFADRWEGVAGQLEAAFDLRTATGAALDLLGAQLFVPRLGLSDDDYRRLLQVEAQIVLSGTTTRAKLIAVFETWTGVSVEEYSRRGRTIFMSGLVPAALQPRLLRLLARTVPALRRVVVHYAEPGDLICGSSANPIAGNTTVCGSSANPDASHSQLAARIL